MRSGPAPRPRGSDTPVPGVHPPYTPCTPPVQTKRGFRRAFGASTRARSGADRGTFSAPENGWGRCPRRLAASPPEYFSKVEGAGLREIRC